MPQPARLIWTNNHDDPAGTTLTGTGHSEPIDLTQTEAVFFSLVVGNPPKDMYAGEADGREHDHLTVTLQVQDASGTWLPVVHLRPAGIGARPEHPMHSEPHKPHSRASVGLFLPDSSPHQSSVVPMVLPPTARIRWDAYRELQGRVLNPASFHQTVISLYGR
ncbi:hypothetical protein ACIRYZ_36745 [Kitasatospora sp. NPDC101155]|uniref:hypothetical protein n=1 Tax=Kitasatospora sp. NPDC101155 TaxID=3364097 RepID=UPI00380DF485